MSVKVLAIAGNFFLFIEVLERFQVVYGTFGIELYLVYHSFWNILDYSWKMRADSGGFHL